MEVLMLKTKWYLAGLFSVIAVLAALGIFNLGKVSAQAPLDVPSSTYLQAQSMDEAKPANSIAAANPGVSGKAPALIDTPTATPPCGGAVPGPWATSTPGPA